MGVPGAPAAADTTPLPLPLLQVSGQPSAPPPPWRNARRDPFGMGGCSGQ